MTREFIIMVLANVVFVFLYVAYNWVEYSILSPLYHVAIRVYFPWYIQFTGTPDGNLIVSFFDINFGLMLFLLAIFVNLFFAYRLQRSKETKSKDLTAKV